MIFQFPPYALVILSSAFMNLFISIYSFTQRSKGVAYTYFSIAFMFAASWPLIYFFELIIADPNISMFLAEIRAVPYQFFPFFFLITIYQLSKRSMPPMILLIYAGFFAIFQTFLIPASDMFFNVWTAKYRTVTPEGFQINVLIPGLWMQFSMIAYHFAVYIISIIVLFKAIRNSKRAYRMQFASIIFAIMLGISVAVAFAFKLVSFGPYNPIPAAMLLTSSVMAIAIFKYRLLSIVPYARESVFDNIQSPVLILDSDETLIDYNHQAKSIFRIHNNMIGTDIRTVLDTLNIDWSKLITDLPCIVETRWGTGDNYKFSTLKKAVEKDYQKGYIIVFSDITAQLDAIETQHEREILTYKESILSDMHDGIGGTVAVAAMLAQSSISEADPVVKNNKIEQIVSLLENGSFELRSMLNMLDKETLDWLSLIFDMRTYSSTVLESKNIQRKFELVGDIYQESLDFNIYISIFRLFKEVITNVIKHSDASNVVIKHYFHQDYYRMTVSDDGKGIGESKSKGYGLKNMAKRAEKLNGTLEITSENGTTVSITIKTQKEG